MHDDVIFADRFPYQLTMLGIRVVIGLSRLLRDHIGYEIDTEKNRLSILPKFLSFACFDTVELNRLQCSNIKMYDDPVFADRFRYRLTMFEVCILIGLSRLLKTHVAYETAI